MTHNIKYETQRLVVVPLSEEHIEELRVLRNKNRHFFYATEEISSDQQKKWFEGYKIKKSELMFAAYMKNSLNDGPIAFAGIMFTDEDKHIADCGRMLVNSEKTQECGIGRELYSSICMVAFEKCNIEKMITYIVPGNDRSAKMCRAIGCDVKSLDDGNSVVTLTKAMLIDAVSPKITYLGLIG
ncbi:MAG: GNAT family N-acetyltransferase [Clostridia bacterium]|nr:GNAT family N-acetyltransferase [Clostridia bacterium]